jgi:hypothetical protein
MGRSELETPPELWVAAGDNGDGSDGRLEEDTDDGSADVNDNKNEAGKAEQGNNVIGTAAVVGERTSVKKKKKARAGAAASKGKGKSGNGNDSSGGGSGGGSHGGNNGRPDEEKLSMLSSLRTRFHRLIYREDVGADETRFGVSFGVRK